MGANSYLLAIGKFKKDIDTCLSYPKEYYQNVTKGSMVTSSFFQCESTKHSKELSEALGMDGLFDFDNAFLTASHIKSRLENINSFYSDIEDRWNHDEWDNFIKLMDSGFSFFFMPNA